MHGIIDSDETPGGCWTLFHSVAVEGFPALREGQQVEFEWDVLDSPPCIGATSTRFECGPRAASHTSHRGGQPVLVQSVDHLFRRHCDRTHRSGLPSRASTNPRRPNQRNHAHV